MVGGGAPGREGGAGGGDCGVHVIAGGLGNLDERLAGGGVDAGEVFVAGWRTPLAADVEAKVWAVRGEPVARGRGGFGRGSIGHALEEVRNDGGRRYGGVTHGGCSPCRVWISSLCVPPILSHG